LLQEEPGPSVQRDNPLLKGPGLKPPHRVPSYRVSRTAHGLRANRGFINPAQSRPKVKFFNLKVKEKNKEYAGILHKMLRRS